MSTIRGEGPSWNLRVFCEAKITLPVFGSAGLIVGGRTNLDLEDGPPTWRCASYRRDRTTRDQPDGMEDVSVKTPGFSLRATPIGTLYRGGEGMWTWVLHRITGVSVFFFLFVHVLDTALVRVSPAAYDEIIATYKTPIVNLLEVGLVGAVLFHAFNGVRIILIDFWSKGPRYQRQMTWVIAAIWLLVMIPGIYFMMIHTIDALFGSTS